MDKLITILERIKPDVNFNECKTLIDDGILDSFDIVTIVAAINDEFVIDFPVSEITPENFNSAQTLYQVIENIG